VQRLLGVAGRALAGFRSPSRVRVIRPPSCCKALMARVGGGVDARTPPRSAAGRAATDDHPGGTGTLPARGPWTRITEAMWPDHGPDRHGASRPGRLCIPQFHLDRHVPLRMDLTSGKKKQRQVRTRKKRASPAPWPPITCIVMDRWYARVQAVQRHPWRPSSKLYVCRGPR